MNYWDIVNKVSKDLNLPIEVVDSAYKSYWKFIRETIKVLPLKECNNEEEFSKLKTNFNIPSLGKLSCTHDRMLGVRKRLEIVKQIKKKRC